MNKQCQCRQCLRDRKEGAEIAQGIFIPAEAQRMVLCPTCGNKRCPHAADHIHACAGSNEPGQAESAYEGCKPHNAGGNATERSEGRVDHNVGRDGRK